MLSIIKSLHSKRNVASQIGRDSREFCSTSSERMNEWMDAFHVIITDYVLCNMPNVTCILISNESCDQWTRVINCKLFIIIIIIIDGFCNFDRCTMSFSHIGCIMHNARCMDFRMHCILDLYKFELKWQRYGGDVIINPYSEKLLINKNTIIR